MTAPGRFTVPADWLRNVIEIVQPAPPVLGALLREAGLHWNDLATPGSPIDQRAEVAIIQRLAAQFDRPGFPAELGLKMSGRTSTVVSYLAHSSRNMGAAMRNTARYVLLTRPGVIVDFTLADGVGRWSFDNHDPWVREAQLYQEFATSCCLAMLRTATGQRLRPSHVSMRTPSRGQLPQLSYLWECAVSADDDLHFIDFPEDALAAPLVRFDAPLLDHLKRYSDILLRESPSRERDLTLEAERAILNDLSHGPPPVARIAAALGMSTRTLTRRLAEAGLSYRQLLEDVRRRKALLLLADGSLALGEIAFLLGYSEHASFTNAFRRWTGVAPGAYRAGSQGGGVPARRDGGT